MAHKCIHVFRLSHVVLVIISITTFCLVPSKNSWNSASEDPNITYKDQIKGLESSLLSHKQNNLFHKSKGVEVFKQYHFFPQENGCFAQNNYFLWKNTWWVIKASSNGSFFVTFLLCFFTFEGQRGDFFEIFLHKRTKKL